MPTVSSSPHAILPTEVDQAYAIVIATRILMRRNFETLRDRAGSKYFKNIKLQDIPWSERTKIPLNFPPRFLERYPTDFSVNFTTLGCNMLKCYKHDLEKECLTNPFLINGYVYACNEACFRVFEEFNEFLTEKFKLEKKNSSSSSSGNGLKEKKKPRSELTFETLSLEKHGNTHTECFCGMQLHNLKKFALLPSSRWNDPDEKWANAEKFLSQTKPDQMKLAGMAGLVDSPPLKWNVSDQNINFTHDYCRRFRKEYDVEKDECYTQIHRTILGFIVGENTIKQFSDRDLTRLLAANPLPIDYIMNLMLSNKLLLNPKYQENSLTQKELEKYLFVHTPDKIVSNNQEEKLEVISLGDLTLPISIDVLIHQSKEITSIILDLIKSSAQDAGIEGVVTLSPLIMAHLLKYYSHTFLTKVLTNTTGSLIPFTTRLSSLFITTVVKDMCLNVAVKVLTTASRVFSGVFSVAILTLIPEILLGVYNIGGFNNEITRNQIEDRKQQLVNDTLISLIDNFRNSLSYVTINNKNSKYISPLITPEYMYTLCLIEFIYQNPELKITIGYNGINQEELLTLIDEYLLNLEINSVGQYIDYSLPSEYILNNIPEEQNPEEGEEETISQEHSFQSKLKLRLLNNSFLARTNRIIILNRDLYLLMLSLFFIFMASLLFTFDYNKIIAIIMFLLGTCCISLWTIWFKPIIQNYKTIN